MNNSSRYIAAVDFDALTKDVTPGLDGLDPGGIVNIVVRLFFPIAGFILLAMLIYSGYQYMFSQGDPKTTAKAQQTITYSIVGFVVIFAAYMIVNFFGEVLDIKQIKDIF